jgi:hypothetical protein
VPVPALLARRRRPLHREVGARLGGGPGQRGRERVFLRQYQADGATGPRARRRCARRFGRAGRPGEAPGRT